jgi:predicted MPP superfamily phosphohydrolase
LDAPWQDILMQSRHPISRRRFLKTAALSVLGTGLLGAGGYVYTNQVEPGWFELTQISLALPRLAPEFDGYRIAQISDIHLDVWTPRDRLGQAVAMIDQQSPDLVVITGDFVTYLPGYFAADLAVVLGALASRRTTLAVLGNHDHWTDAAAVRRVIAQSGIVELRNAVHTLRRGAALLHIAGVDDVWERQDRLDLVLAQLPAEGAAILLAHEPDYADTSAATGRFDLQLSGHSHGGQVIIPFWGPVVLPDHARKYPVGQYQVGEMVQYTNRGLGMISPHVRFNCRPEIALFTLRAK